MTALITATVAVWSGFVGALAAFVGVQLLTGGISLRGLLRVKHPGRAAGLSPARPRFPEHRHHVLR